MARTHGIRATYQWGCRCEPCRAAERERDRKRVRPWSLSAARRQKRNQKRRHKSNVEIVRELKSNPCMDCGGSFPFYVMQFDHLRDKEFGIAQGTYSYGPERLLAEIEKCELVCANCHAIRTWERKQQAVSAAS